MSRARRLVGATLLSLVVGVLGLGGCQPFPSPQIFPTGAELAGPIRGGDLDGDGVLDVVAVASSTTIAVLRGDGSGGFLAPLQSFTALTDTDLDAPPTALAVANLDGDRRLDVAAVRLNASPSRPGRLLVLRGLGDGRLQALDTHAVGIAPSAVAAGDLDGNGTTDLVTANTGIELSTGAAAAGGSLSILRGLGDGSFAKVEPIPAQGRRPRALALVDSNDDSHLDIVYTDGPADAGSVVVLLGDGALGFREVAVVPVGPRPTGIESADLNADGIPDLLTVNAPETRDSANLSVLLGRGDGTFQDAIPVSKGGVFLGDARFPDFRSVAIVDVDGDARPDLVGSGERLAVLRGFGDGRFSSATVFETGVASAPRSPDQLVVADLDGRGARDIVVGGATDSGGALSVLRGREGGGFDAQIVALADAGSASVGPRELAAGDFDGDGSTDLASVIGAIGVLRVAFGAGDGTLRVPVSGFGSFPELDVAAGDMNGDGLADVITTGSRPTSVNVLLSNGDGTFGDPVSFAAGAGPGQLVVADFDRDGALDVAATSEDRVAVLLGNGDGTLAPATLLSPPSAATDLAVTDLNADTHPDLAGCSSDSGDVFSFLGRGDGTFGDPVVTSALFACFRLAVGDLDGDGLADLLTIGAPPGAATIRAGRGDGTFGAPVPLESGLEPSSRVRRAVIARLDGDAMADIAILDIDAGEVEIFSNDGHGGFPRSTAIPVGTLPLALIAADLDHSGTLDLIIGEDGVREAAVRILLNRSSSPFADD